MKKLIFLFLLIGSIVSASTMLSFKTHAKSTFGKKHVDVILTSTGGCRVHIVGDVSYTIFPPAITGFSGTVTISGNNGCPNGTLVFQARVSTDQNGMVTDIDYGLANQEFTTILHEEELDNTMKGVLDKVYGE